ncbi:hypothetical protein E2C01_004117 [Portunus trituberculatus]|uniref:Uncharacterized protein n=1 Tax=Portunus trituberculatus TaxID=210409 RepID=A0A5B7CPN8_PORTR|nr:hypothetical protein [Portunus trituberculatus]
MNMKVHPGTEGVNDVSIFNWSLWKLVMVGEQSMDDEVR